MKKQHTLEMINSYEENYNKYIMVTTIWAYSGKNPESSLNIQMYLKHFHCPDLSFDIPLDRILSLANKAPKFIPNIMQTKRNLCEVDKIYAVWNEQIQIIQQLPEDDKISTYFGLRTSSDLHNTSFKDSVYNLYKVVDDTLFFTNLSIKSVSSIGKEALPFWMKKKICKTDIIGKENKALMPPEDHLSGWND